MNIKFNKKGNALALFVLAILVFIIVVALVPPVNAVFFETLNIIFK